MKKLVIILFAFGLSTQLFAQDTIELSEVVLVATNYKYLNKTNSKQEAIPVKFLRRKAAAYDVKQADFYDDDYDFYTVSFFIPQGKIVAAYDKEGNIIRTIEKFKDIALPAPVAKAVAKRFLG